MRRRSTLRLPMLLAMATAVTLQSASAGDTLPAHLRRYDVTIVGIGGFAGTSLTAINENGDFVGNITSFGTTSAYVWIDGVLDPLPKNGFGESLAVDINDDGVIAGALAYDGVIFSGSHFATTWVFEGPNWAAVRLDLGDTANAISNGGVIAGRECTVDGTFGCDVAAGFVQLPGGSVVPIDTFGGDSSTADGVNDLQYGAGRAFVGKAETPDGVYHAFVLRHEDGGQQIDLGTLPPRTAGAHASSEAHDVNNANPPLIVGASRPTEYDNREAVVWHYTDGAWDIRPLGKLGGSFSRALAVNDDSYVVGSAGRAFIIYDPLHGELIDLNDLTPCDETAFLESANDINNAGQIVGTAIVSGYTRGFVLDPYPAGDCDGDGLATLVDAADLVDCLTGPDGFTEASCTCIDLDCSDTIDLKDAATFQQSFGRPVR